MTNRKKWRARRDNSREPTNGMRLVWEMQDWLKNNQEKLTEEALKIWRLKCREPDNPSKDPPAET